MTNNANTETELFETIIRDLVAYADTLGLTGIELIMNIENDGLGANRARTIISSHTGYAVTDSMIDDLTEFIDDSDDNWNE